jgi:ketosteroid isomerase-like protein
MIKGQELADLANQNWTTSTLADMKVRVIGDVAIVTGVQTLQGSAKGFIPGPRRFTDIFVKRNGRWQIIGRQMTLTSNK